MLKNQKYFLLLLKIVSIVTFVNVVAIWWLPFILPLSSFSIVQSAGAAFAAGRNGALIVSLLLCALLYWTTVSIGKHKILLPLLSFLYLISDIVFLLMLLTEWQNGGPVLRYILKMALSIALLVPLGKYCWNRVGNKPDKQD